MTDRFLTHLHRAQAEINDAAARIRIPEYAEANISRAIQHLRAAQVEILRQRNIEEKTHPESTTHHGAKNECD